MKVGRISVPVLACFLVCLSAVAPAVHAYDEDLSDPTRKPGGINPADIDSRCSIMAGREDRAFLNCQAFLLLNDGRNPIVDFLIKTQPAQLPHTVYEQYLPGDPRSRRR